MELERPRADDLGARAVAHELDAELEGRRAAGRAVRVRQRGLHAVGAGQRRARGRGEQHPAERERRAPRRRRHPRTASRLRPA
jgi:hypothetical protein